MRAGRWESHNAIHVAHLLVTQPTTLKSGVVEVIREWDRRIVRLPILALVSGERESRIIMPTSALSLTPGARRIDARNDACKGRAR